MLDFGTVFNLVFVESFPLFVFFLGATDGWMMDG